MTKRRKSEPKGRAAQRPVDPIEAEFGPGVEEPEPPPESAPRAPGPIPGIACAGDGCLLKPAADLIGKFTLRLARGHGGSLSRAALSGIELMKALRDFLDEEIALAEGAAGRTGRPRYEKLEVE